MKRLIIFMAVVVVIFALATPVLADSLGISPSHIELEVPADGSAVANLKVHYFSGDVKVDMVDIPLRVEPNVLHVDALDNPVDVQLTIFGDASLGSHEYEGFIKFTGLSGGMIAIAVQVRAKVTNIVEGQPVPQSEPSPSETAPPSVVLEKPEPTAQVAESSPPIPPASESNSQSSGGIESMSLNTVIIIAGGLVFLGLVILAVSLAVRRKNH